MYNFIKSYTKYLQVYIRGLCHLYEVLLYVKKVARIRNRSFRIRFQVFVYVKKCASTKWCLYEVKSLTDEAVDSSESEDESEDEDKLHGPCGDKVCGADPPPKPLRTYRG